MVHADASRFKSGASKAVVHEQVLQQAAALFEGQQNWVCNTANAASLLWHAFRALPSPSSSVNWAGFYVLDKNTPYQLILGPFQGKVACQTISFGRGVCGVAAESRRSQLVPNVDHFPGHIACDGESRSELVVPILRSGVTVAIIDIDCAVTDGFDMDDQRWLEKLASLLSKACDW